MRVRPLHIVILLLALLLALLQYKLWLGSGGEREGAALRAQVARQESENQRLQLRNEALKAEVEDLKSGEAAVEERARSELGMVRPGETFYRVIEDRAGSPSVPAAPAPGACSMRNSWLYLATRSERHSEPVLIWVAVVATAMSAMVVSSVSPERWETIAA